MKTGIGFNALSETGYGAYGADSYKKIREHGYSCVDFQLAYTGSVYYTLPENEAGELLAEQRRRAEAAGVSIWQVHGPWRYPPADGSAEERAERMEKMKRSLRACKTLGCKNWVIHPLMPYGLDDTTEGNAEKTRAVNKEFMSELLQCAEDNGVTVCLENMPFQHFSLSKPEDILGFVREMDSDNLKICLDTGHVNVFEDLSLSDSVRMLGSEIRVLHVHDNIVGRDLHLLPYFGNADWKGFTAALRDIGFEGVMSLETGPSARLEGDVFEEIGKGVGMIAKKLAEMSQVKGY